MPQNSNFSVANILEKSSGFAAIFVDYENVYYHLRNRYADIPELGDFVIDLLMSLQRHLEEKYNVRSIISKAYADYERIKSTPQGSLYLMRVETVYVLGTEHKNAADMRLCIYAMEEAQAPEHFVYVEFDPTGKTQLPVPEAVKSDSRTKQEKGKKSPPETDNFFETIRELDENERVCVEFLIKNYGTHHEIYLTPFLRKLPDALPNLADWERKGLVGDLEFKGALRMEKRTGIPYDYTIAILNYNHPVVREMC